MTISLFLFMAILLKSSYAHQHGGQHNYEVIIVGAGLAGLGAAKELYDQNILNFTVLEANDYIGGRVKNMEFNGSNIPLGAGWIHAADQNHSLYRLAQKYNLKLYRDQYDMSQVIFWNRKTPSIYPSNDVTAMYSYLKNKLEIMDSKVEGRISKGAADTDLASGLRWAGWKATTLLHNAMEYYMFDFENGIPPGVISASTYGYTGSGEDYIITDSKGYLYPVMQEVDPVKNKILLNQTVTRIKRNAERSYSVYTDNGKEWTAKFVLVTVSSGVLNSDAIQFEPGFPDWKIESLALVPMCYYCKIYAQFSEKFWNDTIYFMVASQVRGNYFHWQDVSDIFNISNVLLATLTGQTCKNSYAYTDNEIADQIYKVLRDVYPKASTPIKIVRNAFNNDPKFMGSYSYQTPGINENDYRSLEHPIQQNLWFAGEHLGRIEFGYTHGAYEIGQNVTKKMLSCMKGHECPADKPDFIKLCKSVGSRVISSLSLLLLPFVIFYFN